VLLYCVEPIFTIAFRFVGQFENRFSRLASMVIEPNPHARKNSTTRYSFKEKAVGDSLAQSSCHRWQVSEIAVGWFEALRSFRSSTQKDL